MSGYNYSRAALTTVSSRLGYLSILSWLLLPLASCGTVTTVPSQDDANSVFFDSGGNKPKTDTKTNSNDLDSGNAQLDDAAGVCEFAADPPKGEAGAPCDAAEDCNSALCIETAQGKICTKKCIGCCPSGFKCQELSGGDAVFACLPRWLSLCRPCSVDADCVSKTDDSLCINYGDAGRFCGGICKTDAECPENYLCKDAKGNPGSGKQCVLQTGECKCSSKAVEKGASTACSITNASGTCAGTRKCSKDGLTVCDAAPATGELCDGLDNNCNGQTDEAGAGGCIAYWLDTDKDGFGLSSAFGGKQQCLCKSVDLYTSLTPTDCNDDEKAINPLAPEWCNDIDDNCNGKTDEDCDADSDGYCDANAVIVGKPAICKKGGGDCDDTKVGLNPGAKDLCGDNIDQDCDGKTDNGEDTPGCTDFFFDGDKDGFGSFDNKCLCAAGGLFTAVQSGDCNDSSADINPAKVEICGNGVDDNCNGAQDEQDGGQCVDFYVDNDSDGYGAGKPACLCAPNAQYTTKKGGDCDDTEPKLNPAMVEVCDGIDNNCSGAIDEENAFGCVKYYADVDKDTFGNPNDVKCLCAPDVLYNALGGGDCDDLQALAKPGMPEICNNFDDNCDGQVDENSAKGCVDYWVDGDDDGYGDVDKTVCSCLPVKEYPCKVGGDCNDKDDKIHPTAEEKCNGVDDNCNTLVDEKNAAGCKPFMLDEDEDGYGVDNKIECLCGPTKPFSTQKGGDCNDSNPAIHPDAAETCDGVDNNCNGVIDENGALLCISYYADLDKDGFGSNIVPAQCQCKANGFFTSTISGDCNDGDPNTFPKAQEFCDGKDTDCDGKIDPVGAKGCKTYYLDVDADAYGDSSTSQCACAGAGQFTALVGGDCNDKNDQVKPNAPEICNGIDDNCNGVVDVDSPLAKMYFKDADKDGYGAGAGTPLCQAGNGYVTTLDGDCNDNNILVFPTAKEICNAIDDNCNGQVDEGQGGALCPAVNNGTPTCKAGVCGTACAANFYDIDGNFGNGCECQGDPKHGTNNTCGANSQDLGAMADTGASQTVSGSITPDESGDWFHVKAVDNADAGGACDKFKFRAFFKDNPDGKFVLDVYKGGCAGGNILCSGETDSSWQTNFYGGVPSGPGAGKGSPAGDVVKSPAPEAAGECKCTGAPGAPGMNICSDNTADFYVRVYRQNGAPASCAYYTLQVSNGL